MTAIVNYNNFNEKNVTVFIHLPADRLEYTDTHVWVFNGKDLQGVFAINIINDIFLTEKVGAK
jgi:hypothetical protein